MDFDNILLFRLCQAKEKDMIREDGHMRKEEATFGLMMEKGNGNKGRRAVGVAGVVGTGKDKVKERMAKGEKVGMREEEAKEGKKAKIKVKPKDMEKGRTKGKEERKEFPFLTSKEGGNSKNRSGNCLR